MSEANKKPLKPVLGSVVSDRDFSHLKGMRIPRAKKRVALYCGEETRTKGSFKAECDINNIVKKAALQGALPPNDRARTYGDFTEVLDYQDAIHTVHRAEELFATISSSIRKRFNNDPAEWLAFMSDPKNAKEMVDLGLAVKRPEIEKGMSAKDIGEAVADAMKKGKTDEPKK